MSAVKYSFLGDFFNFFFLKQNNSKLWVKYAKFFSKDRKMSLEGNYNSDGIIKGNRTSKLPFGSVLHWLPCICNQSGTGTYFLLKKKDHSKFAVFDFAS